MTVNQTSGAGRLLQTHKQDMNKSNTRYILPCNGNNSWTSGLVSITSLVTRYSYSGFQSTVTYRSVIHDFFITAIVKKLNINLYFLTQQWAWQNVRGRKKYISISFSTQEYLSVDNLWVTTRWKIGTEGVASRSETYRDRPEKRRQADFDNIAFRNPYFG